MCPSSIHSEQVCLSELSTPLTDIHGMLGQVCRMQHSAALHTCARDVKPAPEAARPLIAHASKQSMPQGRDTALGRTALSIGAAAAGGSACAAAKAEVGDVAGTAVEKRAEGSPSPDPGQGCAVQHTFRVTVETASGLAAVSAEAEARFIRYLFPGARRCTERQHICVVESERRICRETLVAAGCRSLSCGPSCVSHLEKMRCFGLVFILKTC